MGSPLNWANSATSSGGTILALSGHSRRPQSFFFPYIWPRPSPSTTDSYRAQHHLRLQSNGTGKKQRKNNRNRKYLFDIFVIIVIAYLIYVCLQYDKVL